MHIIVVFTSQKLFNIQHSQFDRRFRQGTGTEPRLGRFYPKGILKGIAGVFRVNLQPFRCVGLSNDHLTVDFNHALAGKNLQLSIVIGKVGIKSTERGETSIDWMETLTFGPGMQGRWQ